MKEGYTEITIPAQTYKSCSECKYYETKMLRSGKKPEYSHNCKHPEVKDNGFLPFLGNLPNEDKTPDFCPFLTKNKETALK